MNLIRIHHPRDNEHEISKNMQTVPKKYNPYNRRELYNSNCYQIPEEILQRMCIFRNWSECCVVFVMLFMNVFVEKWRMEHTMR